MALANYYIKHSGYEDTPQKRQYLNVRTLYQTYIHTAYNLIIHILIVVFRGLRRGAGSFSSHTALSLLELAHKALGAVRFFAEVAFDVMSPDGVGVVQGKKVPQRYYHHQADRRQVRNIQEKPEK